MSRRFVSWIWWMRNLCDVKYFKRGLVNTFRSFYIKRNNLFSYYYCLVLYNYCPLIHQLFNFILIWFWLCICFFDLIFILFSHVYDVNMLMKYSSFYRWKSCFWNNIVIFTKWYSSDLIGSSFLLSLSFPAPLVTPVTKD